MQSSLLKFRSNLRIEQISFGTSRFFVVVLNVDHCKHHYLSDLLRRSYSHSIRQNEPRRTRRVESHLSCMDKDNAGKISKFYQLGAGDTP